MQYYVAKYGEKTLDRKGNEVTANGFLYKERIYYTKGLMSINGRPALWPEHIMERNKDSFEFRPATIDELALGIVVTQEPDGLERFDGLEVRQVYLDKLDLWIANAKKEIYG